MRRTTILIICAAISISALASLARADTFGGGANAFDIPFVTIGNPNNVADNSGQPRPAGSVGYEYRIGKYEISRSMIEKANAEVGLNIGLADLTPYGGNGADKPAGVSWFDAARFVNWMNTSTGHTPAYKFDANNNFQLWQLGDGGYDPANLFRNSNAFYFLPSMNEWYKAAFFDPVNNLYYDYPTGTNGGLTPVASGTAPNSAVFLQSTSTGPANITQAGGLSPYGTMAQGGNVGEWLETELDFLNDSVSGMRSGRGGGWENTEFALSVTSYAGRPPEEGAAGFRIASVVPEPGTLVLFITAQLAFFSYFCVRRRRNVID